MVQKAIVCLSLIISLLMYRNVNAAYFIGLGDLPGGSFYSEAHSVSADGSVVVGRGTSESGPAEAFRWTSRTGMVGLGDLPGGRSNSQAFGVSADGKVVVGYSETVSWNVPFRWTSEEGMVGLSSYGYANATSADGSVVVGDGGVQAWRWTSENGIDNLGYLPGANVWSYARDVSDNGSVVVGWGRNASNKSEAFRWTEENGMVGLGFLPGMDSSSASGVSPDGTIVVGHSQMWSVYGGEAFLWTADEGMIGLGILPGTLSSGASGVSADGSVVIGCSNYASGRDNAKAFIWDNENGMQSLQSVLSNTYELDLDGWYLIQATAISDDGDTIVGWGRHNGQTEAFITNISSVPIPGSVWLFVSGGVLGLAGFRKKTRA